MNILGFNIGQNYKGILNLGSTINTPLSATLQSVTDGVGVASPLQLSTTRVNVDGLLSIGTTAIPSDTGSGGLYLTDHIVFRGDATARTQKAVIFSNTANARNAAIASGWYTAFNQNLEFITASTLRGVIDNLGNFALGTNTASARLHVRGDGTNPIARFENSAGTIGFRITSDGQGLIPISVGGQEYITAGYDGGFRLDGSVMGLARNNYDGQSNVRVSLSSSYGGGFEIFPNIQTQTSGNIKILHSRGSFGAGAGSANYRPVQVEYTINNSGAQTGTATGIFLNATETALNGMTHNLIDLQLGGVSSFRVGRAGLTTIGVQSGSVWNVVFDMTSGTNPGGYMNWKLANDATSYYSQFMQGGDMNFFTTGSGYNYGMNFSTSGVSRLRISPTGLIQFGGTTNAFPALKRNGAALEVRLADDLGFAGLSVSTLTISGLGLSYDAGVGINIGSITAGNGWRVNLIDNGSNIYGSFGTAGNVLTDRSGSGRAVLTASSILDLQSTTKGFLPPRQTEAQRLAIAGGTPAIGLMVYQTDGTDGLYVYKAGGWQFIA